MFDLWERIRLWREKLGAECSARAFWLVMTLGFVMATMFWHWCAYGLVERYKEDRRAALEDENKTLHSSCAALQKKCEEMARRNNGMTLQEQASNDDLLALQRTNALLLAELAHDRIEIDGLRCQIRKIENEYDVVRSLRDKIPVGYTNLNQLAVVCDLAKKMNLRTAAIDKSIATLDEVKNQMFQVALKPLNVTDSIFKTVPMSQRDSAGVEFMSQFYIAVLNIDRLYVHFMRHITTSADNVFLSHINDSAEQLEVRLQVPFKCLENSRCMLKHMLELNVVDREFYAKLSKIIDGHLKSCGAKGAVK